MNQMMIFIHSFMSSCISIMFSLSFHETAIMCMGNKGEQHILPALATIYFQPVV